MDEHFDDHNTMSVSDIPDNPISNEPYTIKFHGESDWLMEMSVKDGFRVNREAFPDWEPDDFVKEFLRILEETIDVRFD